MYFNINIVQIKEEERAKSQRDMKLEFYLKTWSSTAVKSCQLAMISGPNIFCLIQDSYITYFKDLEFQCDLSKNIPA